MALRTYETFFPWLEQRPECPCYKKPNAIEDEPIHFKESKKQSEVHKVVEPSHNSIFR